MERLWTVVLLGLAVILWSPQMAHGVNNSKTDIYYLFYRPTEPIFFPKEDDVVFSVPSSFYEGPYQAQASDLSNRFGDDATKTINISNIDLPDLTIAKQLGRKAIFSLFVPFHREMAKVVIDIFLSMKTFEEFLSVAAYCRDQINSYMYIYSLSVAILYRNDTRNVPLPSYVEVFPDKYFDSQTISQAREESEVVRQPTAREPIEIPRDYTASDLDPEHRVAYFREDIGINLHHWQWHLIYQFSGPREIVNKDRRGELFYYLHQQIMARYNFERLCNQLARVKNLNLLEPIAEGYFPKLDSLVASQVWPGRQDHTKLRDINRESDQLTFTLQDLIRWSDRIFDAIHLGKYMDEEGQLVQLTEETGIDVLGNIVEASILSPNPNYYGNYHNLGHVAIAYTHDPDGRHLEPSAVMGDTATAMRDPVFYRWHGLINQIYIEHKNTLPRYTEQQLTVNGVTISDVKVVTSEGVENVFLTHWQQSEVDLSRGLDFNPRGPVFARFTHLQHEPFSYQIEVDNTGSDMRVLFRIFLAPMFDERGLPFQFRDQRLLFIELDKFVANLKTGNNSIERHSTESAVTIPFEQTYRSLDPGQLSGDDASQFNFCGCGWPQNMLIPKGSVAGTPVQLFVMISNITDMVDQPAPQGCNDAVSYCGYFNQRYPDIRPMGFPFDRFPRSGVNTLADILTPNMFALNMMIRFRDKTVIRSSQNPNSTETPTTQNP